MTELRTFDPQAASRNINSCHTVADDRLPDSLRAALARVADPAGPGTGLPNPCYTDESVAEIEAARVLAPHWAGLGLGADIATPGDVQPVELAGRPLVMLRDRAGRARVFHNVCRHRGMQLVDAPASRQRILRCPYHSWCYDLDGSLRRTPHVGGPDVHEHPDFDPGQHGLHEVRAHEWMGVVFVNLDGTAPDFEVANAALLARWGEFSDAPHVHTGDDARLAFDLACNWKLAVENYCEAYHLPWVHPALNSYSRLEDHYNIAEAGAFSGQGSTVYSPALTEDGRAFPALDGLSAGWETGAEYIALYPNVLLGLHKDHGYAIVVTPDGPAHCRERFALFYLDEAARAPAYDDLRAANLETWRRVFAEDVFAVEGMQRGRRSPAFDGGVFTPVMDGPTRTFHAWTAAAMLRPAPSERTAGAAAAAE